MPVFSHYVLWLHRDSRNALANCVERIILGEYLRLVDRFHTLVIHSSYWLYTSCGVLSRSVSGDYSTWLTLGGRPGVAQGTIGEDGKGYAGGNVRYDDEGGKKLIRI